MWSFFSNSSNRTATDDRVAAMRRSVVRFFDVSTSNSALEATKVLVAEAPSVEVPPWIKMLPSAVSWRLPACNAPGLPSSTGMIRSVRRSRVRNCCGESAFGAEAVPADRSFTVNYSLNGYLPQVVPVGPRAAANVSVDVAGSPDGFGYTTPELTPNPVYAQLERAPPPAPVRKGSRPRPKQPPMRQ